MTNTISALFSLIILVSLDFVFYAQVLQVAEGEEKNLSLLLNQMVSYTYGKGQGWYSQKTSHDKLTIIVNIGFLNY